MDRQPLINLALKCGAFQNEGGHGIPAGTLITFEPDELEAFARAYAEQAVKQERERCETMASFSVEAAREGYMRLWRAYERVDRGGAMYFLPTAIRARGEKNG